MTETVFAPAARKPAPVWDIILTIVLILGGIVVTFFLVVIGAVLSFGSGDGAEYVLQNVGIFIAVLGPPTVTIITVVIGIVRMVRRRLAFIAPAVGLVASGLIWTIGFVLFQVGTNY